jgi:copper chaperone NosL
VAFGIVAMADFWRWEYDYGHSLNPNAAIIVPGMSYQPPLIGFKQLLNFGAYSMPDLGGWTFLTAGIVLLACVIFEWQHEKKMSKNYKMIPALFVGFFTLSLAGCSTAPQPIRIGKDQCDFCKMTISDNRFGAEIITRKSKVYKFDDEHCIINFLNSKTTAPGEIAGIYFVNFNDPHEMIKVEEAHFLQSPSFKSPMNGNIAAFVHEDSLVNMLPKFKGNKISWEDMQK